MYIGPSFNRDGLVLHYDVANDKCYRGEETVNIVPPGLSIFNDFGVPATLTIIPETYKGNPIYKLTMIVNDVGKLNEFRRSLGSHGVYTGSLNFKANTKYAASIIWRPVNKTDVYVGGITSNIGGWKEIPKEDLNNGWFRHAQIRDGSVGVNESDNVYYSFRCPSLELNEKVEVDFCCSQVEEYKDFPTPYTKASRGGTVASGGGLIDLSGKRNHADLYNNPRFDKLNKGSLVFDGINQYGKTIGNLKLSHTDNITISLWFKTTQTNTGLLIEHSINTNNNNAFGVFINAAGILNKIQFGTHLSSSNFINTFTDINDDNWHNIIFVNRRGTGSKQTTTYLDGKLETTNLSNSDIVTGFYSDFELFISTRDGSNYFYKGNVNNIMIWDRGISESEAVQVYNSMRERYR